MSAPAPTPLSAAALGAQRLGVLGGSFDPPHLGHLHAARRARAAFALDHVLFVPAARPPHKPERILAGGQERLDMLALLLAEEPDVSVWAVELARSGPSYTLDTLRALRAAVPPPTRLFLVLGADNLRGFPGWRGVEEIVRLAQPIVVQRTVPGPDEADLRGLSRFARARLAQGRLASPALDASATELRAELARGAPPGPLARALLPPRLAEHIQARALYRRP